MTKPPTALTDDFSIIFQALVSNERIIKDDILTWLDQQKYANARHDKRRALECYRWAIYHAHKLTATRRLRNQRLFSLIKGEIAGTLSTTATKA